jgi:uncharacterized protein (TIGR02145 family)
MVCKKLFIILNITISFIANGQVVLPAYQGLQYNDDAFVCGDSSVYDYDGNVYETVLIGEQCWMKENIKATHYADGTLINQYITTSEWGYLANNNTDKGYCYYNNNAGGEAAIFGALYTWAAATNGVSGTAHPSGVQGICPNAWHIPSNAEWKAMEMYLGMTETQANATGWRGTNEGGKLKQIGFSLWNSPNTDATNESGFTALPGSYRTDSGAFATAGSFGNFWMSDESNTTFAWRRTIQYNNGGIYRAIFPKSTGLSVRCVRN